MKTDILIRVRKHFNSDLVPASTNRHNARQWVRAVRLLGDRWILCNGEAKWGHRQQGGAA